MLSICCSSVASVIRARSCMELGQRPRAKSFSSRGVHSHRLGSLQPSCVRVCYKPGRDTAPDLVRSLTWQGWLVTSVPRFTTSRGGDRPRPGPCQHILYFQMQLLTTIGYGDIMPQSQSGKLFVSFYALSACIIAGTVAHPLSSP